MLKRTIGLLALSTALTTSSWAHHSTAGYDATKSMTVTGVVKAFHWKNPHIFIYMEVLDENGQASEWEVEAGTPNINVRTGWKADDIKPGDKIQILLHPSREGTVKGGAADTVTLANGEIRYTPSHRGPGGGPGGPGPGGPGAPGAR